MRGWSIPVGRFLGVEVRIHLFFLVLLGLAVSYASAIKVADGRGLMLWLFLLLAIVVREVARAAGTAWWGLRLRSILLLPTGGLMTYESGDSSERASNLAIQRRMALIGPIANIVFALILTGLVETVTPQVQIFVQPWVTPAYLLRALIWINFGLGAVNLLPAPPLDGGRLFRGEFSKAQGGLRGARAAAGLGQIVALAMVLGGLLLANTWLTMIGAFIWIGSMMDSPEVILQGENDGVKMRDVMLTEFSTLSASDTLEDALQRSVHTLQDVFPVVRGASLVGAVSRQGILEALQTQGNGYVQGVMTRSFQTAQPDDSLVKTLRRVMSGQGAQLLPVTEGERVVGIITPQNLAHSIGMLNQRRRLQATTGE